MTQEEAAPASVAAMIEMTAKEMRERYRLRPNHPIVIVIPYNPQLREQLVAEVAALPHGYTADWSAWPAEERPQA